MPILFRVAASVLSISCQTRHLPRRSFDLGLGKSYPLDRTKSAEGNVMRRLTLYSMVTTFALLLSACGPQIQTHYDYTPPASPQGMQCLSSCQTSTTQCQADVEYRKGQCRADAERDAEFDFLQRKNDYQIAIGRFQVDPVKYPLPEKPQRPYVSTYHCDNVSNTCEAQFRTCYRSCGGQIQERQVCVANCEQ